MLNLAKAWGVDKTRRELKGQERMKIRIRRGTVIATADDQGRGQNNGKAGPGINDVTIWL